MTRLIPALLLLSLIAGGCSSRPSITANAVIAIASPDSSDRQLLEQLRTRYEDPAQTFELPAGKTTVITGKKGTRIRVNPADLETVSGQPVTTSITLTLKELSNQSELLRAHAQTVSDGQLLVSGGAYYIGLDAGGEALKLKQGHSLQVQFPRFSRAKMNLFYGQRDTLGNMNWLPAQQQLTEKEPVYNQESLPRSDIDAIMEYADSGYAQNPEDKKYYEEEKMAADLGRRMYEEAALSQLGWINCDRFWSTSNTAELSVHFSGRDTVQHAYINLVFTDENCVLEQLYHQPTEIIRKLPEGAKVQLIAYAVKNDKILACTQDLKIAGKQQLELRLRETTEAALKAMVSVRSKVNK